MLENVVELMAARKPIRREPGGRNGVQGDKDINLYPMHFYSEVKPIEFSGLCSPVTMHRITAFLNLC